VSTDYECGHSRTCIVRLSADFGESRRRASRELNVPQLSVWNILRKRFEVRSYRLQMLWHTTPKDGVVFLELYANMMEHVAEDE